MHCIAMFKDLFYYSNRTCIKLVPILFFQNIDNSNTTNDALNGVETVTKSDENTPGKCFSYNLLQIKPLQK